MKIRVTNNYNQFKTVEGNRNVIRQHVKKLQETLSEEDLTSSLPIIVNEKMEVIDGQHRLEALKLLNKPVSYLVINGADLATVQMLNSSAKSWSLNDYVQSYVKRGNENYIILDEFRKRYELPLQICAALLGNFSRDDNHAAPNVRMGNFVVKDQRTAEAVATYLSEIRKFIDRKIFMDRYFLRACIKVVKSDIDRKQLIHKLRLFGLGLRRQASTVDYLREIEKIYNFRNQGDKVRLF